MFCEILHSISLQQKSRILRKHSRMSLFFRCSGALMFPCISRVWCPWLSSYSRVNGEECDDIELQEVVTDGTSGAESTPSDDEDEVDSVSVTSSDSHDEVDGLTEVALAWDHSAFRGIFSNAVANSFVSVGYSALRICDYFQLSLINYLAVQGEPVSRERRSVESTNGIHPSQALLYDVNRTSFNQTVPQWIFPCGITPNGTFPDGQRPFEILNATGSYEPLRFMDYSYYFGGRFDEWAQSISSTYDEFLLRTMGYGNEYRVFPYGIKGRGDFILRHFGNMTEQYPYASYTIRNGLQDNGTCPIRLFNSSLFFSGGYLGLEDSGFERIYPCGIHPDGLFTGTWLGFPNGTIPPDAYPFGRFPNGTFPYIDYFFNPGFNHAELYLALRNNHTEALQNFTNFANANTTRLMYHHIPTNPEDPFASCYNIYHPLESSVLHTDNNALYRWRDERSWYIDSYLIRAGLWSAQLGAELGVILAQNSAFGERHQRVARALYLGVRAANIIHSSIDLAYNLSHVLQYGPTEGQGELALRNMLTLTDTLNLVNEGIYFCTPAIQALQQRVARSSGARYFTRMLSSLRGTGELARRALSRATAIVGSIGVAGTAALGATLTAQFINSDDHDDPQQRVILGAQIAIAAVASFALGWITRANHARATHENTQQ